MSLAAPCIWRPPSLRLPAWFTAGKQQRKSTGKAQRKSSTGKMLRNTATNTACCCASTPGDPCTHCATSGTPGTWTLTASGISACGCWLNSEGVYANWIGANGTYTLTQYGGGLFASPCTWAVIAGTVFYYDDAACTVVSAYSGGSAPLIWQLDKQSSDTLATLICTAGNTRRLFDAVLTMTSLRCDETFTSVPNTQLTCTSSLIPSGHSQDGTGGLVDLTPHF